MYSSVLIVDDSNLDRTMSEMIIMKEMFAAKAVGYGSAIEGIAYLRSLAQFPERLPAVIFLDVNMPVMDGFDFLDNFMKLKKEVQARCAIFMISATNSSEDMERIKTYPIVRKFYNKPLTPDILKDICVVLQK